MTPDLPARLRLALGPDAARPLGLAVSGGGDSMALLHLAHQAGLSVQVATVHHHLRPEAGAEVALVAQACDRLGFPHHRLDWRWNGQGNLPDAARRGRQAALAAWAQGAGLSAVVLAHTQDDLAETFVMRLARGSGVDGLSAMAPKQVFCGARFLRPLLGVTRAELRTALVAMGQRWVDDPTNDDPTFTRPRVRRALGVLADLGITPDGLARTAERLAQAQAALITLAERAAEQVATLQAGDVVLAPALTDWPEETQRRLICAALIWVAGLDYPPRADQLSHLREAMATGRDVTLAGCRILSRPYGWRILREARDLPRQPYAANALWDGRWRITGPERADPGAEAGLEIRALGPNAAVSRANTALPRASLDASPALWQGEVLVAAPVADPTGPWRAETLFPQGPLSKAKIAH